MKPIVHFSWYLLVGLCLLSFSAKANHGKIVRANWPGQYMGTSTHTYMNTTQMDGYFENLGNGNVRWVPCHGCPNNGTIQTPVTETFPCIKRDADGYIQIGLHYGISDLNYRQYAPAIHLRYTVHDQSAIIAHNEMDYKGKVGDYHYFAKTISVNLSDFLGNYFSYSFEIITENGGDYPVNNHPGLFREYTDPTFLPTIEGGIKNVCGGNETSPLIAQDNTIELLYELLNLNPLLDNKEDDEKKKSNFEKAQTDDSEIFMVKTYPNPFTNTFSIESNRDDYGIIKIFNIQGEIIYTEENITFVKDSPKRIDTFDLPLGMYYCTIETSTGLKTIPLVKQ